MKKNLLLSVVLTTLVLAGCGSNSAKLEAAQTYCDSTNGTLTTSGNLYVCTYEDGSICEAEDFRTASCPDSINEIDYNSEEILAAREAVNTEEKRINACEEETLFYLNINEADFTWEEESESGASFGRNGHVNYVKNSEANGNMGAASDDVLCFIDMVDGNIIIEFSNHEFLGEINADIENKVN